MRQIYDESRAQFSGLKWVYPLYLAEKEGKRAIKMNSQSEIAGGLPSRAIAL